PSIRIWCDGSYRQAHRSLGAAWVRVSEDGTRTEQSIPLPELKHAHAHGSDLAELAAFTLALDSIEEPRDVEVHMDCRNVIEWLSAGAIRNPGKKSEPAVMKAFGQALEAKRRMPRVTVMYTSD